MIYTGHNLPILKSLPDNSVDSVVTDPPYGWKFMGKKWDYEIPSVELWQEVMRVLKPGGYMLVACGTRTQHRMAVNIEDAGFEIRDVITWHYATGFPKSMDVSNAMDRKAKPGEILSDEAQKWSGFGTALKPATEFWTMARKPLEGNVADTIRAYGTGAININATRIEYQSDYDRQSATYGTGIDIRGGNFKNGTKTDAKNIPPNETGRFPSNVVFSCDCEGDHELGCPVRELNDQGGILKTGAVKGTEPSDSTKSVFGKYQSRKPSSASVGTASRFFYVAKASKSERGIGNDHPTVKPVTLMRYFCRMITPPGGIVLDPYNGSGSTGVAAELEFFGYMGIEQEEENVSLSEKRIPPPSLFSKNHLFHNQ